MWQTDVRSLVRSLIFDITTPYTYSDDNLDLLIINAAKILSSELNFANEYSVNITSQTISPDPSEDADFIILLTYKTACLLGSAEVKTYSLSAFSIKDGPATLNMSDAGKYAQERYHDFLEQYDQKRVDYLMGNSAGKVISGPIVYENLIPYIGNMNTN